MQSKLEKVVAGLKTGPRFLKELREFDNLVKAIGECKSKAEEDRIIVQELELLKQRLSDPKLDKSRGKEYMIRLIYCEMLGHDASFAYVKALQFASDPNIHTKKAAYLALTQFLDYNNQLVLLLVNTLLGDLKSDNYLIVCTALVAATKLIGADLVSAVLPVVLERLRHPREAVRKKAVLALHWFGGLDPRREGPLAGVELERNFRTMLCDKDPSVMSAALCALHDCIKTDPRPFKNLIPSFTSILKQVSEHRLPKSYDYHRFPAPFIQIKLLKILALLGAGDRAASDNMAAVLGQALRRAAAPSPSHTIGSALVYEAVRTITTIYPNPQLLGAAAESIASFLRSPSHNLRYVGIDALAGISALNPAAAAEHQVAVLDCLEDPDDTLKLKTLELLYKMTRANNIQVIVDKMMGYLASCSDDHIRRDIVRKVSDLAERYAPSPAWFVTTISEVFRLGGEHVGEGEAHRLTALIAEQDAGLHGSAVEAYLRLLDAEEQGSSAAGTAGSASGGPRKKLPETILLVICWVLGEYGHLARRPPLAVLTRLMGVLTCHKAASDRLRGTLLTALTKLAAHTGGAAGPVGAAVLAGAGAAGSATRGSVTAAAGPSGSGAAEAAEFVHKCLSSQSLELQQRAHELTALLGSCSPSVLAAALPVDASREDFSPEQLAAEVADLPFLEGLVQRALAGGAAPYLPPEARGSKACDGQAKGLRFEAYEPAPYAIPVAAASTSYSTTGVAAAGGGSGSGATDWRTNRSVSGGASSSNSLYGAGGNGSGAAAAAAAEPQLVVKTAGGRKWGPAQYDTDPGVSPSGQSVTAAASMSAVAAAAPWNGQHSRTGSGSAGAGGGAAAGLSGQALERERLAASLFGGGGGGGGAAAITTRPAAPAAAHKQTNGSAAVQGRSATPAAAAPPPRQAPNAMDLLLDLDVPAAAAAGPSSSTGRQQQQRPAAPGQPGGDWMDSLLGASPLHPPLTHQQQQEQLIMGGGGGGGGGGAGVPNGAGGGSGLHPPPMGMGLYDVLPPTPALPYPAAPSPAGGIMMMPPPLFSPPQQGGGGGAPMGMMGAGPGFGAPQPQGYPHHHPQQQQQQQQPQQVQAWQQQQAQQQQQPYGVTGLVGGPGGGLLGGMRGPPPQQQQQYGGVAPQARQAPPPAPPQGAARPQGPDPFGDLLG